MATRLTATPASDTAPEMAMLAGISAIITMICTRKAADGRTPDSAAPAVRIDDHPHLADVARPAVQRHDGHVADDLVVLHCDGTGRARARPRRDHVGRRDVLLEERPIPLRDTRDEALDRLAVGGP